MPEMKNCSHNNKSYKFYSKGSPCDYHKKFGCAEWLPGTEACIDIQFISYIYFSSQDQTKNRTDSHDTQPADLYHNKYYDFSQVTKIGRRILDYQTCYADSGSRSKNCIYITYFSALCHLRDQKKKRTNQYSCCKPDKYMSCDFILCSGRK